MIFQDAAQTVSRALTAPFRRPAPAAAPTETE
jgi:hypothetical protein